MEIGSKSFKQVRVREAKILPLLATAYFFQLPDMERTFKCIIIFRIFSAETEEYLSVQVFLLYPLTK